MVFLITIPVAGRALILLSVLHCTSDPFLIKIAVKAFYSNNFGPAVGSTPAFNFASTTACRQHYSAVTVQVNLISSVVEAVPRRRILRKFVRISDPPPATAKFDGRLELTCEAMGKPAPSIRWLKNDEPIVEYDMESNEIYTPDPTSLARVTSVLLLDDMADGTEDVYTCVAQSGLKTASASTTVFSSGGDESEDILALQKLLSRPKPRITAYYNDIFQEMGTTLLLPCEIHSYPKAQVFWSDTRNNLIFGNDRFKVLPSGALLISDMRWTDMGNFSCTAINKFGEETINTFVYPVKARWFTPLSGLQSEKRSWLSGEIDQWIHLMQQTRLRDYEPASILWGGFDIHPLDYVGFHALLLDGWLPDTVAQYGLVSTPSLHYPSIRRPILPLPPNWSELGTKTSTCPSPNPVKFNDR
ncbi:hypothetical protein EVAR_90668_1 [Eumeta japonica]|uniref:Ig-like domain-containing protein n=1 Tax=Eumeta variegata TaxID=151549 RepID=A0A4C1ZFQ0_EUMVA|nr:hypothetical protein EVAR_90668_1 [Eumeta japonica]